MTPNPALLPFQKDLASIHSLVTQQLQENNSFYDILKEDADEEKQFFIDDFLESLSIPLDNETRLSAVTRLVNLQEESFIQTLKKHNFSESQIQDMREYAYDWVKDYHLMQHKKLLETIRKDNLLTPFYRTVMEGIHHIGVAFTAWFLEWQRYLIFTVNKSLKSAYEDDDAGIHQMLQTHDLLDRGHGGEEADRSYSVLIRQQDSWRRASYIEAFPETLNAILEALDDFQTALEEQEDSLFSQKEAYLHYLKTLHAAFSESDCDRLIGKWADVDRAWMDITAPLQPGHPLEYYEDKYRMAVAPEWDLRLQEANSNDGDLVSDIESMVSHYVGRIDTPAYTPTYDAFSSNLKRVQLYISKPVLYYGSEFNGLFSAQVVPNDEVVSNELGKKIFAFPSRVLSTLRAKPFLKLSAEIFEKEFQDQYKTLLFKQSAKWNEVYRITTIGHEYGHILWMNQKSESAMNAQGMFKNVEEYKATTGGLVAYFLREERPHLQEILIDHIKRSVGLIAWMEHSDALPYYCEALIHLSGLFETQVLGFDGTRLSVNLDMEHQQSITQWYITNYHTLISEYYLPMQDSSGFLSRYAIKEEGHFLPIDPDTRAFVEHYWKRYKEIGQVIDDSDSPENWL